MKQLKSLVFLLLATVVAFTSCSDNKENENGITGQNWTEGAEFPISTTQDVTIRFTAYGKWVATVTQGADWCKLSATAGGKGSQSFIVSVTGETTTDRTATVTVTADGNASSFKVTQKAGAISEDVSVNRSVDEYLNEMYLWNGEYKGLKKDFDQGYEDFFYGNLYRMQTNTLDKKPAGNGKYNLFSYIQKKNPVNSTRAATQIERELEYSFGFTGMIAIGLGNNRVALCPQGIYPDSPAIEKEIKRGAFIDKLNGEYITENNMQDVFVQLMYPESAASVTLGELLVKENGEFERDENGVVRTRESAVSARAMYKNPVLHHEVIKTEDGSKIGYLVYDNFDASYDDVLFDVFKEFKKEGIQDLVLDLRYNGGGHVISANLITSCIAGNSCRNKTFIQYRYNEERMKKLGGVKATEKFSYDNYANLKTSLAAGALGLERLYCLVGNATASASELVINSLKGIDLDVKLIGQKTTGKNVGMEPIDLEINENTYNVSPITFQSYNAKGFGDYENGFQPDIEINEIDSDGDGYFDGFKRYGDQQDPLLAHALQEITGKQPIETRALNRKLNFGKVHSLPAISRPNHSGMIKLKTFSE